MNVRLIAAGLFLAVASVARAEGYPVNKLTCGSAFLLERELHAGLPDFDRPPVSATPIKFCFFVNEGFATWETQEKGKTVTSWKLQRAAAKEGTSNFRGVSKDYNENSMKGVAQTLSASNAEHGWHVLATFWNLNVRKIWTVTVYWDDVRGYFSDGPGGKAVSVAFAGVRPPSPKATSKPSPTETAREK